MRLAIVLLLACAAPTFAACPENSIYLGGGFDAVSQQGTNGSAQYGMSTNGFEAWSAAMNCPSGCYDLPAGVLAAAAHANPYGGTVAGVHVADIYTLTGPSGPARTFQASLVVTASIGAHTGYRAEITGPGGASADVLALPAGEATIDVNVAPGGSFTIGMSLDAGGESGAFGYADVLARSALVFSGLPEGYGIVSCQNYDQPTPASRPSWGEVKALYR